MQRLIDEYGNSLLRMCYLYFHDLQLAEDAVQDTYIKVYQNRDKFKGACSEKTWITGIAINVCKSHLRRSRQRIQSKATSFIV
jgi:RNA polymerase sigma-70 factor (ECF subfamily)